MKKLTKIMITKAFGIQKYNFNKKNIVVFYKHDNNDAVDYWMEHQLEWSKVCYAEVDEKTLKFLDKKYGVHEDFKTKKVFKHKIIKKPIKWCFEQK